VPDSPYGRSLAGILLDHQELLNENINIFMDVTKIDLLRPFVIDRSLISVLDEDTIVEPNSFIRAKMNAKDAIVPLPMAAPSNLAMLMDGHIKRDADDTSGFTEQARGITSSQGQTATQFNGVQANIVNRLKMHVMRMKWMVEDVCQLMVELNQQYMTQAQMVSYIGEAGLEWRSIEPWEIAGDVIVHATTSARHANPDLYAQRVIQLTQVLMPIFQGQVQLNPPLIRWLRVVLQACQIEEVDEIFPKMPNGVRSPMAENIGMLRGMQLHPHPAEAQNGMSQGHVESHTDFLMQIKDDPTIPEQVKLNIQQHIQEHMEDDAKYGMAMQQQQQQRQQAMQGAQGNGTSPQQTGTMAGQAAGSGGVPGAASPGPGAPAGRPM
jgi:hypothetical protein